MGLPRCPECGKEYSSTFDEDYNAALGFEADQQRCAIPECIVAGPHLPFSHEFK